MPNFTKIAIKNTFLSLLRERPLNKITVRDIVDTCGINRNSFYYHFQDIPALIEEIAMEEANLIIENHKEIGSLEEALGVAVDFVEANRKSIFHIYNSVNRDIFEHYLWHVCEYVVSEYGKTVFTDQEIDAFDKELIERFYKCECFGIMMEWLNNGMEEDVHKTIHRFCELRKGMIEEMIKRSKEIKG